jgi:CHAT domain-containing protein
VKLGSLIALHTALILARAQAADTLAATPHAAIRGRTSLGETRIWQIQAPRREYLLVSGMAPEAVLNLKLIDVTGKALQTCSSIGGTGGKAVLYWIVEPNKTYSIQLALAGTAPVPRDFFLTVDEARESGSAEAAPVPPLVAAARLVSDGQKLLMSQHYQEALRPLNDVLEKARAIGEQRLEAQALYRIGMAHFYLQDRPTAAVFLQKALALERANNQAFELSLTLNNLAAIDRLLGFCNRSLDELQQALAIRRRLGDTTGQAYTLLGIADAYYCTGDAQQALDTDLAVLQLWRELKNVPGEADTQNTLGLIYMSLGDWRAAQNALEASRNLWSTAGNRKGEAFALFNIALLRRTRCQYPEAAALDRKALSEFKQMGEVRGSGYALELLGELDGARRQHAKALLDLAQAESILDKAGDRYEDGYAWLAISDQYAAAHRLPDAERAAAKALALERDVGNRNGETTALYQQARCEASLGQTDASRDHLQQAIRLIESSRNSVLDPAHRASYLATRRDVYEFQAALEVRSHDYAAAFETSERAHARTFLDEASGAFGIDKTLVTEAEAAENRLQADSSSASIERLQNLQRRLHAAYPSQSAFAYPSIIGVAGAQRLLPHDTELIEYLAGSDAGFGFVLTRESIRVFKLPAEKILHGLATQFYTALSARARRYPGETLQAYQARIANADLDAELLAKRLSALLLPPSLLDKEQLFIVDDGPLYQIPFSALPGARDREITRLTSASIYALVQSQWGVTHLHHLLIIANPAIPNDAFTPLEFSSREAAYLASIEPSGVSLVSGKQADAATLVRLVPQFELVHIAAHAVIDSAHPFRSGLLLSDGKFDLPSIMRLNVKARLVTLAACDTGMGRGIRGEGLMSMTRAFLYAGAGAVLSSLWPIDDEATDAFMQSFYRALEQLHLSLPGALRAAQQSLQSNTRWSNPYYWAAFVIEGQPLPPPNSQLPDAKVVKR